MKTVTLEMLASFATKLATKITEKFVKKESGKGLSTNDYTTAEKQKLGKIAAEANNYVHPTGAGNKHIPSGGAAGQFLKWSADGTAVWGADNNTTYSAMTGATASAAGKAGLVPAPSAGSQAKFLKGDGSWGLPDAGEATSVPWSGVTGKPSTFAPSAHSHGNADISGLDAAKLTGTIDLARLPQGALERCVVVASDTARLALTKSQVQQGDTVKVTATGKMYFVIDDTKLNAEAGYEVYTAGSATSVPWSGVTGKPSTFAPAAHNHTVANITDLEEATEAEIDSIISGLFA